MSCRKEKTCDDCGLPISICNALAMVKLAEERHGDAVMMQVGYIRSDLLDIPGKSAILDEICRREIEGRQDG